MRSKIFIFWISMVFLSCSQIEQKAPFPFYQQTLPSECGATCLKMIAEFHGKKLDVEYLLKITNTDLEQGVNLLALNDAANIIGLKTLGVKVTYERLCDDIPLPVIAHWNSNHFVVVVEIKNNMVSIADPSFSNILNISKEEFCAHWLVKPANEGVLLLFEKEEE